MWGRELVESVGVPSCKGEGGLGLLKEPSYDVLTFPNAQSLRFHVPF